MSGIAPGDVVVCVRVNLPEYSGPTKLLTVGQMYRVDDVYASKKMPGRIGVIIRGVKPNVHPGFDVRLFRKLRPADPEFVELIKRVRVPETVS